MVLTHNTMPLFVLRLDSTPVSMVLLQQCSIFPRRSNNRFPVLIVDMMSSNIRLFLKALHFLTYGKTVHEFILLCIVYALHTHPLALHLSHELLFGVFNLRWCALTMKIQLDENSADENFYRKTFQIYGTRDLCRRNYLSVVWYYQYYRLL